MPGVRIGLDAAPDLTRTGDVWLVRGHAARTRPASWYDPGRFWSGDNLRLSAGARLGGEIAVQVPAAQLSAAGD